MNEYGELWGYGPAFRLKQDCGDTTVDHCLRTKHNQFDEVVTGHATLKAL